MADTKTTFVNRVGCHLTDKFSPEQIKEITDTIYIQLNDYEIQDRCTDIEPVYDKNSPIYTLQNFIAVKKMSGLSEKSLDRYYQQCYKLLMDIGKPVQQITTSDIRFYLINYKQKHNTSNRTLNGMRQCYSTFFSWCYENELISKNPCLGVDQIKYEKKISLPFTNSEMEELRRACTNSRDRALVEFLYATGCRVSEVVALDRTDINFQRRTAVVFGKGAKERTVYINEVALLYLEEYLTQRTDCNPCLFLGKRGRLSKDGIESCLHKIGKRAGVDDVHPHRFRRTLATNMLNRGAAIQDVATILGHEDVSTTQIYCYIDQKNVAETYDRLVC